MGSINRERLAKNLENVSTNSDAMAALKRALFNHYSPEND